MNEKKPNRIVLVEKRWDALLARYLIFKKARHHDELELETIHHEDIMAEIIQDMVESGLWLVGSRSFETRGKQQAIVTKMKKIPAAIR